MYLKVKSVEEVTVPRSELPRNGGQSATFDLHLDREITPKTEFQVAEAQVLNAGQTYHWTYTVELPGNPAPTFLGHYVRHEWKFMAGLDAKGNDPDSGWQSVALY